MAKSLRNIVLLIMLAGFVLMGCSLDPAPVDADSGKAAGIPFASSEELSRIAHMDGYADYRVVRPFAVIEMHQVAPTYGWTSAEVSALPVVIYEHGTELPKYYEFPVLQDGKAVGTVTGTARKSIGAPVEFVLGFSRSFDEETSRSIMSGRGTKLVDVGGYPSRLGIYNPYTGRSADAGSGLDIEEAEIFQELTVKEFLMSADPEELEELGITEEAIEEMLREYHENRGEIEELWEMIEEFREELLQLSDEEIAQESIDASRSAGSTPDGMLDRWHERMRWYRDGRFIRDSQNNRVSRSDGSSSGYVGLPCGPGALVRIVLGLDRFGDKYITRDYADKFDRYFHLNSKSRSSRTSAEEDEHDRLRIDLYTLHKYIDDTIYDELGKGIFNSGITFLSQLRRVLWEYTDYTYETVGHGFRSVDSSIQGNELPVISMRTGAKRYGTWEWHYRVIIGTKSERVLWFRIFRRNFFRTNNYYYMIDNGTDGMRVVGDSDKFNAWTERSGRLFQIAARAVVSK